MLNLKNYGYSPKFTEEILLDGLNGYKKILEEDRAGLKHLYRSKEWRKAKRWMDRKKKRPRTGWAPATNHTFLSLQHKEVSYGDFYKRKKYRCDPGGGKTGPSK